MYSGASTEALFVLLSIITLMGWFMTVKGEKERLYGAILLGMLLVTGHFIFKIPRTTDFWTIISSGDAVWWALRFAVLVGLPVWLVISAPYYRFFILVILGVQYLFVNLTFSTTTQNIVLVKDISAPFLSILILSVWWVGEVKAEGSWRLRPLPINVPIVVALIFLAASSAVSPVPFASVEEYGKFFAYFIIVLAMAKFVTKPIHVLNFVRMIIALSVFTVVYGISQKMGSDLLVGLGIIPDWGQNVFVSTQGNQNFFAGYLIVTMGVTFGYWLITPRWHYLLLLPFLFILQVISVLWTESRASYLGITAGLVIIAGGLLLNFRNLKVFGLDIGEYMGGEKASPVTLVRSIAGISAVRYAFIFLIAALLVVGVAKPSWIIYPFREYGEQIWSLRSLEATYTNRVRLIFWQDSVDGALRKPWFGRGLGVFNMVMPETRPPWYHRTGVSHNTRHSHNDWLEWLMETGVIGLSIYLWIVVAFFYSTIRCLYKRRRSYDYPLLLGIVAGCVAQWIQGTFDVELRWTGNAVTHWFSVGFALAFINLPLLSGPLEETADNPIDMARKVPARKTRPASERGSVIAAPLAIFLTGILAFSAVKSWQLWRADNHLRNNMAYTDSSQGTIERAMNEASACRSLDPYNLSNYYKLAYTYLVAGDMESALRTYRELQFFAPNYAQIHINLSFLQDRMGKNYAAAWEHDRAAIIEDNVKNHREAGDYWYQLGEGRRALAHYRLALRIDRDDEDGRGSVLFHGHSDLHFRLARVYILLGEMDRAERELRECVARDPGHIQGAMALARFLQERGRGDEAAEVLDRIQTARPGSPEVTAMLAMQASEAGEHEVALMYASNLALAISPNNESQANLAQVLFDVARNSLNAGSGEPARCLDLMGWAFATVGRWNEADRYLSEAFRYAPNDPAVQRHLGMVRAARAEAEES